MFNLFAQSLLTFTASFLTASNLLGRLLPATKFAYNFSFSDKCFIYDEDPDIFITEEDMIKTWKLIKVQLQ